MIKRFWESAKNGFIICGKNIYISVFALVAALCVMLWDFSVYPPLILLAALLHEAGHIAALKGFGGKLERLYIYPFGADMRADTSKLSYKKETLLMLAGVISNVLLFIVSLLLYHTFRSRQLLFFGFCNAFFAVTNLIPIASLDGGRALEAWLCAKLPLDKALSVSAAVSRVSYAVISVLFTVLFFESGCNMSFVILLAYTALGIFVSEKLI